MYIKMTVFKRASHVFCPDDSRQTWNKNYKFADRNQKNLCIEQKNVPADVEKNESEFARLFFWIVMWDNKEVNINDRCNDQRQ